MGWPKRDIKENGATTSQLAKFDTDPTMFLTMNDFSVRFLFLPVASLVLRMRYTEPIFSENMTNNNIIAMHKIDTAIYMPRSSREYESRLK